MLLSFKFKASFIISMMFYTLSNLCIGQNINEPTIVSQANPTKTAISLPVTNALPAVMENAASVTLLESHPRLKSSFSQLFPNAVSQRWGMVDKNYFVSFVSNGRKARANFNQNGTLNYSIVDCTFELLPPALIAAIQKNYTGYTLLNGIVINAFDELTYQVVLENAAGYITLKYNSDTLEETQQVKKMN